MGWNKDSRNFFFAPDSNWTLIWHLLISVHSKYSVRKLPTKLPCNPFHFASKPRIFVYECLCVRLSHRPAGNELVFLGHRAASPRVFCGFSQFLPFSLGMHWWETLTRKLYEIHIFSCADVSSKWLPIWSFILKNVDFKKHAIKLNLLIWENKSLPLLPVWMFYSSMNCKMTKFRKLSRGGIYWTETFLTQNIHGSNIS